ncbi:MAG: hypothetical protein NVS3B25_19040 [Hymenobacter sp.]
MKLFASFYLILVGLTCMVYALQANQAKPVFVSGLIALAGALLLSCKEPNQTARR